MTQTRFFLPAFEKKKKIICKLIRTVSVLALVNLTHGFFRLYSPKLQERVGCKRTLQTPPPHPPNVLFALSNCPLLGAPPILIHANRRKIRLMEGNAKYRHLKKLDRSIFLDDDICNAFCESYLSIFPISLILLFLFFILKILRFFRNIPFPCQPEILERCCPC
jgi:hypothetical protein